MTENKTKFDFFKGWSEEKQNIFLKNYLVETTNYLLPFKFPNSPDYTCYLAVFHDEEYNRDSKINLEAILLLLSEKNIILPFRFKKKPEPVDYDGTRLIYYKIPTWPIGKLHDKDFDNIQMLQHDELVEHFKVIAN